MLTRTRPTNIRAPRWALRTAAFLALLLSVAIYWQGLHGPFLLDDLDNLEPLHRWMQGELTWQGVVFGNHSGPLGRPLSMASFLMDAAFAGNLDAFAFKPTNLAIHLLCGLFAGLIASQCLTITGWKDKERQWVAVAIMALWLWLPIQVSSVLYVVQRMAQLNTLFTFAALSLYLHARQQTHPRRQFVMIWGGVPMLATLAILSKENGVLVFPLIAAAELILFNRDQRAGSVVAFMVVTTAIPVTIGIAALLIKPSLVTAGFRIREFTVTQRLLTEPRALWSYLQTTFFPVGPRMGLFHDNFPVSTDAWHPWTTPLAIVAWIAVVLAAVMARRKAPLFSLGVFGFLICHSLEAGPLSLEIYFEHRNYGAALFAVLGAIGLLRMAIADRVRRSSIKRSLAACAVAALSIYGLGAWMQTAAWASESVFFTTQYEYNPTSPRLLSNLAGRAMMNGDLPRSLLFIEEGERNGPPSEYVTATLWRFLAYCEDKSSSPIPPELYDELDARMEGRIGLYAMVAWDLLADRMTRGCRADSGRISSAGLHWLARTPTAPTDQAAWRTRYDIGRIVANAGDIAMARGIIARAWTDSDHNNGIGVLLFQLDASLGDAQGCRDVLAVLERHDTRADKRLNRAIRAFREALDRGDIEALSK